MLPSNHLYAKRLPSHRIDATEEKQTSSRERAPMATRKAGEILSVTIEPGLTEVCLATMGLSILTYIGCLSLRDVRIKRDCVFKTSMWYPDAKIHVIKSGSRRNRALH